MKTSIAIIAALFSTVQSVSPAARDAANAAAADDSTTQDNAPVLQTDEEATEEYINKLVSSDVRGAPDIVDLDWTKYGLNSFAVSDLVKMVKEGDKHEDLKDGFRTSFMTYYQKQVDLLPPVCEGTLVPIPTGQKCRDKIKAEAKISVEGVWSQALTDVQREITNLFTFSKKELEDAYDDSFFCDHGCECQFIENQYTFITAQIKTITSEITTLEQRIKINEDNINGVHDNCDFSALESAWQTTKTGLEATYKKEYAAVKSWRDDAYELEDAVDQDLFKKANDFEYSSEMFDKVYKGQDQ